jgi:hypothetical protein
MLPVYRDKKSRSFASLRMTAEIHMTRSLVVTQRLIHLQEKESMREHAYDSATMLSALKETGRVAHESTSLPTLICWS